MFLINISSDWHNTALNSCWMNESQMYMILKPVFFPLYHTTTLKDFRNHLVQNSHFTDGKTEIQKNQQFVQGHTVINERPQAFRLLT